VTFAVRDLNKGMKLASELADTQTDGMARLCVCSLHGIKGAYDLLVNCTPVGMYPRVDERPVDIDVIARCGAVFDAVYNPRKTELLDAAQTLHIPCVEGLGMLFYQAVEAQRIWFGEARICPEYTQQQIYLDLLANMW